jgi:hypothetical protein
MSYSNNEIGCVEGCIAAVLLFLVIGGIMCMRGCQDANIRAIPPVTNSQGQTTIHIPADDYNAWLEQNKDKKVINTVPISDGLMHGRTSELIVTYEPIKLTAEKGEK